MTVYPDFEYVGGPVNTPICPGGVGDFYATFTGGMGTTTYQWWMNPYNGSAYTGWIQLSNGLHVGTGGIFSGVTTTQLTITNTNTPVEGLHLAQFRLNAKNVCEEITTQAALAITRDVALECCVQPQVNPSVCYNTVNNVVSICGSFTGLSPITYTWEYNNSEDPVTWHWEENWHPIGAYSAHQYGAPSIADTYSGWPTRCLTITGFPDMDGTRYRLIAENLCGSASCSEW